MIQLVVLVVVARVIRVRVMQRDEGEEHQGVFAHGRPPSPSRSGAPLRPFLRIRCAPSLPASMVLVRREIRQPLSDRASSKWFAVARQTIYSWAEDCHALLSKPLSGNGLEIGRAHV